MASLQEAPQLLEPLPVLPDRPIPPAIGVRLAAVAASYSS